MNYRSISNLNFDIKRWISELPNDLDIIVGIPRSGLLVANILALHLNLPMTDVEGLCENRILQAGIRLNNERIPDLSTRKKILVVDDSVLSGTQMKKVKSKLKDLESVHQIYYAAVYATPQGCDYVDFWYEIVNLPRVFEWNVMHHSVLENSCMDIDGILCRDPTPRENDDGNNYKEFLVNAKPLIVPSKTIGWLVTCRLEKYRKLTEEWLKKYGITYKQLVMMDLPDKETRLALGNHAKFKAEVYKSTKALLFIESSKVQAYEIVRLTGKPVLCTETGEMINPGVLAESCSRGKELVSKVMNNPFAALIKAPKFLKGKIDETRWRIKAEVKKRKLRG